VKHDDGSLLAAAALNNIMATQPIPFLSLPFLLFVHLRLTITACYIHGHRPSALEKPQKKPRVERRKIQKILNLEES
jgi:hypothetical protein